MPKEFIRCTRKEDSVVWVIKGPSEWANLDNDEKRKACKDPDTGEVFLGEKEKKEDNN